jgi:hypothetical protein
MTQPIGPEATTSDGRYSTAIQLLNQAEATTWARLTSFLTLVGILAGAWGLTVTSRAPIASAALALTGFVISLLFYPLMKRSREFVSFYEVYARALENGAGPLTEGFKLKAALPSQMQWGSRFIAPAVPKVCAWSFAALALGSFAAQLNR